MKQVIQNFRNGELRVEEVPQPQLRPGGILVQNRFSLISAGTERATVEVAQSSMLGKAQKRPDLVRQTLDNVRREGVVATVEKVRSRLSALKELGYSSAGVVLDCSTEAFKPGDRVACAGGGYASHAEYIFVPKNLAVRLPDEVGFDEAAFSTVAAIALQGVRQADVRLGECVAVIGLGLIGLITVQLLKASGCRVIGFDISEQHFALARRLGCDLCGRSGDDDVALVESFSQGLGADAVIITAATPSNAPVEAALAYARKRGRVVIVGAVGMNLPRSPFYEKELDFRIACSYGPGRYDPDYEERGQDYPAAYVRWSENRNMQAVVDLLASRRLDLKSLVTHTFAISDAEQAYALITGKGEAPFLGVLLRYPEQGNGTAAKELAPASPAPPGIAQPAAGFIGAGNFAQSYLLPPLQRARVPLLRVATTRPVNATSVARQFGFAAAGTEPEAVLSDPAIDMIFVATRHDSHAGFVQAALAQGKHVFVEKPLAIDLEQLDGIRQALAAQRQHTVLQVGFNRRFSAPFRDLQRFFANRQEPLVITYRVHAGFVPPTHWMQAPEQGGRLIGEACHFIDCMVYLTGSLPVRVFAEAIRSGNAQVTEHDNVAVTLAFADGSVGNLLYLANGDAGVPKEYCEVYGGGRTAILDNFRQLTLHQRRRTKRKKYNGAKGHQEEVAHFLAQVSGSAEPELTFASMYTTTRTSFAIVESLRTGRPVRL